MHRKLRILVTILLFGVIATFPVASLQAQSGGSDTGPSIPNARWQTTNLQSQNGLVAVLVEVKNGVTPDALWPTLANLGAQELYRVRLVYNGIAIVIDAQQLSAIGQLPDVAALRPLIAKQILDTLSTNASASAGIRDALPEGATGEGVRIGIIDSGIDYTHAHFGGPGTPAAYANNDRTVIETGSFPTARVIGGYDFAGDNYDARGVNGSPIPVPDTDPLDCNGLGTHVAGTVAGLGVTADGNTYTGPYNQPLDLANFRISPGVAPRAELYALKVLGCNARSTTLILPAIERALDPNGDGITDDRLDAVLISLGTPFGGTDDPDFVAVEAAVAAGMLVVVGSGNVGDPSVPAAFEDGSAFYAVQSPGSAAGAISVAALNTTSPVPPNVSDATARFSNLGPQRGNLATKPDLAAPGVNINSAAFSSGNSAAVSSGTASAAAQVVGAVALLRQLHPDWQPVQIKAALVNTATPLQSDGTTSLLRSGMGRLDVARATSTTLLAYATELMRPVGLNFGALHVSDALTRSLSLTIENVGGQDQRVGVGIVDKAGLSSPGVRVTPTTSEVDIPAGASSTINVTVEVDASQLVPSTDPAIPLTQAGLPRHYLNEQSGALAITPTTGSAQGEIRVPYVLHAKSASNALVSMDTLVVPGGTGVVVVPIRNTGARNSTFDSASRPLLSAFELAHKSADEPLSNGSVNAADMRYVGVASNYNLVGKDIGRTRLFFGIATQQAWSTPNEVRFEVWIDANKDGTFDYAVITTSLGNVTPSIGNANDVFLSVLIPAPIAQSGASLEILDSSFLNRFPAPAGSGGQDTAPFNSSVLFMDVSARLLGLTNNQSSFRYQVRSYHRDAGRFERLVDQTPLMEYDAAQLAVDATNPRNSISVPGLVGTPVYLSTNGVPLFVRVRGDVLASASPPSLLVLFHHNAPENQAQVVPVEAVFSR